jgi:hypothetical protein
MLCDHEINPTLPGDPSTPPADPGEVSPPQPLVAATRKPKKPAKKAVKKSYKKSYKKVAKKKK